MMTDLTVKDLSIKYKYMCNMLLHVHKQPLCPIVSMHLDLATHTGGVIGPTAILTNSIELFDNSFSTVLGYWVKPTCQWCVSSACRQSD